MRKIVSVLMLVFALVLGGCSAGLDGKNDDYKFDGLQAQIDAINTAIAGDAEVVKGIQDNVAALQAKCEEDGKTIKGIQDNVAGLQADVAALKAQIVVLQADSAANADAIAELQAECEAKQTQINELQVQITNLQTDVTNINITLYGDGEEGGLVAELAELKAQCIADGEALAVLQSRVDGHDVAIADLQERIGELEDSVCSLGRRICVAFWQINALGHRVDSLAGAIATFSLSAPGTTNPFGTGFYVNMTTGGVYQWVGGVWVPRGGFLLSSTAKLKAPMFVLAEKSGSKQVKISWTSVAGATGYEVHALLLDHGGDVSIPLTPVRVANVGGSTFSVTLGDSGGDVRILSPDSAGSSRELTYVVVAKDANGAGASSYAVGPLTGDPH